MTGESSVTYHGEVDGNVVDGGGPGNLKGCDVMGLPLRG